MLCSTAALSAQGWQLKSEVEGIKIYNRSVEHSRIKELKMTTTVKADIHRLLQILNDVERYPEWMHGCKGGEKCTSADGSESGYKVTIQFPKPFSWRVMYIQNTIERDSSQEVYIFKTKTLAKPSHKDQDLVLMDKVYSSWILRPLPDGMVAIESYLFCDPSGNIPFWLVNALLDKGPLKTIQRLLRRVEEAPEIIK